MTAHASREQGVREWSRGSLQMTLWLLMSVGLAMLPAQGCENGDTRSRDDALVVVVPQSIEQIDPRLVSDAYGLKLSRLIFASLVTIDPRTLEVVPDLAERVDALSATRFRVVLKPNLQFSDGSALDAQDVMATFRSVASDELHSRYAASYRRIRAMHAEDSRTVVFELEKPNATFLTDLELPILRAEDEHRALSMSEAARCIGAGPYVLARGGADGAEVRANPHWHGGRATYPKVRFVVVRDDNTRALRLLGGGGDVALNALPQMLVPMFGPRSGFTVHTAPGIGTTYLGFNTEAPALRDPGVRRALARAIDRATIVRAKFAGRARLASSWIPQGHWASTPALPTYAFDRDRARRELDAAGLPDPDGDGPEPRLRLTLRTTSDRFRQSIARAIAAMLGEVGVDVEVRPSEIATLLADLNRGHFEMAVLQVPEVFEPNVLSWFFGGDKVPGPGREGANRWRYRNAELDALFARGIATTVRAERIAIYAKAQEILARDLPVIPLWQEDVVAVTSERASRFGVPRDGRFGTLAR